MTMAPSANGVLSGSASMEAPSMSKVWLLLCGASRSRP
jgi:hypothetical protein